MSNANNVTVGKPRVGGAVFRAPLGTDLPTDAVSELNAEFKNLGYCSEDGVNNENSPESDNTKAWGGDIVMSYQSSKPDTFGFKLIEALNIEVLKTIYGDDKVTGTIEEGLKIEACSEELEPCSWVIDMVLRNKVLKRIVIPEATITELEEITYNDEDPIGYGVTLMAVPDANKNTHYEYLKKSVASRDTETAQNTEVINNESN